MYRILLFLLLAPALLPAGELPDFRTSGILVLQDGFIALKIENSSLQDWTPPAAVRDKVFISLAINGVKRAEYLVKTVDPTIFLKRSLIIFKTNFRAIEPLRLRIELNGERAIPEADLGNNVLETDLQPAR